MRFYIDRVYRDRLGGDFAQLTVHLVAQGSLEDTRRAQEELLADDQSAVSIVRGVAERAHRSVYRSGRTIADCTTQEAAEAALRLLK